MRKKTEKIITAVEAVLKEFEPMFKEHGGGAELVAVDEDEVIFAPHRQLRRMRHGGNSFRRRNGKYDSRKVPSIKRITYTD